MTPTRIQVVRDLFHKAVDTGTDFLEGECAEDPSLRTEILELVESYRTWSSTLLAPPASDASLPRFGPYQCDSVLGAGGMGTVYRAHRDDGQFARQVAIKVLRTSLRTEWYRQRFLAEREILARLTHRNIARMLDGGMTAEGEPYLVMELIEGEPIHDFVNNHARPLRACVELICQAAATVEYAHANLVVHRDLKPGNVMVTTGGEVKLLDFGTSKLADEQATQTQMRFLTPAYASPEQLRNEAVTTATDIYSLGLVAFKVIVGEAPFPGDLLAAGRAREEKPLPESPALPRDLWIILSKATAFDPSRRYPSAADFDSDLRRFLDGKPVLARPQTLPYRLGRFIRRRPWAVALTVAGGIVIVSLAVLAAVRAQNVQKELEINERTVAFTEALFAQGAATSLAGKPNQGYRQKTVVQAIADASKNMKAGLPPAVEIRLRYTIAPLQYSLADYSQLKDHAHRVRQLASTERERAIADHIAALELMSRQRFPDAEAFLRQALTYLDHHREESVPSRALVHGNLGVACFRQGRKAEAAPLFRACRTESAARDGVKHSYYLRCSLWELQVLSHESKTDEVIRQVQALIQAQDTSEPPLELSDAYILLATVLAGKGKGEGEVEAWGKAFEIAKRYSAPPDHECLAVNRNYLFARLRRNKDVTAVPEVEGVAKHCPTAEGGTVELKLGLAEGYKVAGRLDKAEATAREAVQAANQFGRRGFGFICWAEQALGIILVERKKNLEEAKRLLEASRAEYLQIYGPVNNVSVERIDKRLADLAKLPRRKSEAPPAKERPNG